MRELHAGARCVTDSIATALSIPERTDMKPRIKQFASQLQPKLARASGVILMLIAGQIGVAQQSAPQKPSAAATAGVQPAATIAANSAEKSSEHEVSGNSPNEAMDGAIKVHGHWLIELRNPDGTLADRRDFENSLAVGSGGDALLVGLLAGYYVPGDFGITLQGPACATSAPAECNIVKSLSTMPGSVVCAPGYASACSASLAYNFVLAPSTGSTSIILSGSVAAPNAGTITNVGTFYNACDSVNGYTGKAPSALPTKPSTNPPSSCVGTNTSAIIALFTYTGSFTPLQVIDAGQTVHVTVTITFS